MQGVGRTGEKKRVRGAQMKSTVPVSKKDILARGKSMDLRQSRKSPTAGGDGDENEGEDSDFDEELEPEPEPDDGQIAAPGIRPVREAKRSAADRNLSDTHRTNTPFSL